MEPVSTKKFKNSSWTDIAAFSIFVFFVCGWVYVGAYAIITGNPDRLLNPVDSSAHICGTARQPIAYEGTPMTDRGYLFYMNENPVLSRAICVAKCPTRSLNDVGEFSEWTTETGASLCEASKADEVSFTLANAVREANESLDSEQVPTSRSIMARIFTEHGPCPTLPIYGTIPILRRCVPYVTSYSRGTERAIRKLTSDIHPFKLLIMDLYQSRLVVLLVPLVMFGVVSLIALTLRYSQEFGFWFSIVLGLMASYGFTGFLLWSLICSRTYLREAEENDIKLGMDVGNHYVLMFLTVTFAITSIGSTIAYTLNQHRINRIVALFKESRVYFSCLRMVWLLPTLFTALLLTFFYSSITILSFLVTSDRPTIDETTAYLTFRFQYPVLYTIALAYTVFSVFWMSCFNLNYQRGIVGHLTAQFYFSRGEARRRVPFKDTLVYAFKAFRHSGTFVLLSLLDIVLWAPKRIFSDFAQRFLPLTGIKGLMVPRESGILASEERDNRINRNIYQTVQWRYFLLYPFESPLILVGLEKYSYFKALKKTHMIYLSCPFPIDGFTATLQIVFWLSKLGPVCLAGMLALILTQHQVDTHLFAIPVSVCCLFTYYTTSSALTSIETVLSTVLLCFSEDVRIAHSSSYPVYYTGPAFLETMKTIAPSFGPVGHLEAPPPTKPHPRPSKTTA